MFKLICLLFLGLSLLVIPYVLWKDYVEPKVSALTDTEREVIRKSQLYS